jgi:hypothetical protein
MEGCLFYSIIKNIVVSIILVKSSITCSGLNYRVELVIMKEIALSPRWIALSFMSNFLCILLFFLTFPSLSNFVLRSFNSRSSLLFLIFISDSVRNSEKSMIYFSSKLLPKYNGSQLVNLSLLWLHLIPSLM